MILIEPLLLIGNFFYSLTHHPWAAIITAAMIVAFRRGWLLKLIFAILLIAFIHDAITGQLANDLK